MTKTSLIRHKLYCFLGLFISLASLASDEPTIPNELTVTDRACINALHASERKNARTALVEKYNAGAADPTFRDTIRAEEDTKHQTIRAFHADGKILAGAKARALLLHGVGASYSNHSSMRHIIQNISNTRVTKKSGIRHYLQNKEDFGLITSEAIDLPGHGVGPELSDYMELDTVINWFTSYLQDMKKETPDLPLIVICRSSSPQFITEVNRRTPGIIDAIVMISPAHPGNAELIQKQHDTLMALVAKERSHIDLDLVHWVENLSLGIQWRGSELNQTPTLIITGSDDEEILPEEREIYSELNRNFSNIEYVDIEHAIHDVFRTTGNFEPIGKQAYDHFYAFLKRFNILR